MLQELLEGIPCIFKLAGFNVSGTYLAPDLILRMRRLTRYDLFEVFNRVCQSLLLPRYASELEMCVDLILVDRNRLVEPFNRLIQITALLMNQTEVVMC